MEERNWNMVSNSQLEKKCEELKKRYEEDKIKMIELHKEMTSLSVEYCEIKEILDKRQGKKNGR